MTTNDEILTVFENESIAGDANVFNIEFVLMLNEDFGTCAFFDARNFGYFSKYLRSRFFLNEDFDDRTVGRYRVTRQKEVIIMSTRYYGLVTDENHHERATQMLKLFYQDFPSFIFGKSCVIVDNLLLRKDFRTVWFID